MLTPPDPDELEISVLGRGVGESCVVHLGSDQWMVVDSFLEPGSRPPRPAACHYLDALGVSRDSVTDIVVTHFDTDHYRGIDRLHDYYRRARLHITDALLTDEFLGFYEDDAEPAVLEALPATITRASERMMGDWTPGLRGLKAGTIAVRSDDMGVAEVLALAPTEAAIRQSRMEIAAAIATGDRASVTSHLKDDNRCSVVLHITGPAGTALLCGDLVADAPEYGWHAVLEEPTNRRLDRAQVVKVPHHGSEGADHPEMWDRLVEEAPVMAVAPYWPSALPRIADCARLSSRGPVWQAAPSVGFEIDEFGNRISQRPKTGIVQARRKRSAPQWSVVVIPPAFQVV